MVSDVAEFLHGGFDAGTFVRRDLFGIVQRPRNRCGRASREVCDIRDANACTRFVQSISSFFQIHSPDFDSYFLLYQHILAMNRKVLTEMTCWCEIDFTLCV